MYLIVSGSGRVGCAVARALLADGKQVRMLARTPAKLEELRRLGAEVMRGDLRDPASLARACHAVENVLATAHAIDGKGSAGGCAFSGVAVRVFRCQGGKQADGGSRDAGIEEPFGDDAEPADVASHDAISFDSRAAVATDTR